MLMYVCIICIICMYVCMAWHNGFMYNMYVCMYGLCDNIICMYGL
jgi:hypothetical protein